MTTDSPPPAEKPSSFRMIRTLAGISILSGLMIVLVVKATEARIEFNKTEALNTAVFSVLEGAADKQAFRVTDSGFEPVEKPQPGENVVYAGYDEAGKLVGVAVETAGQGYGGVIRALFGYDAESQTIIGFKVLGNLETPGLGDRIAKDPAFLANFDALDVSLDDDKTDLVHNIVLVKSGEKTDPWQIDAISGATISSRAVTNMVAERSAEVIPHIYKYIDQLRKGS